MESEAVTQTVSGLFGEFPSSSCGGMQGDASGSPLGLPAESLLRTIP